MKCRPLVVAVAEEEILRSLVDFFQVHRRAIGEIEDIAVLLVFGSPRPYPAHLNGARRGHNTRLNHAGLVVFEQRDIARRLINPSARITVCNSIMLRCLGGIVAFPVGLIAGYPVGIDEVVDMHNLIGRRRVGGPGFPAVKGAADIEVVLIVRIP